MQFYASIDLKTWTLKSELDGFDLAEGNVVECPDLVALELEGRKRWVLIVSLVKGAPNAGSGTRYIVGDFDGHHFVPEHQDVRWLDYGPDNYAGVTFHNTGEKVLLIGWMSNWSYAQAVPTAPWRSAMTLPRELVLVSVDGKAVLAQNAPPVFCGPALMDSDWNAALSAAWCQSKGILQLNLGAENQPSFELTFSNDNGERLLIGFDAAEQHYFIDRRDSGPNTFSSDFSMRATAPKIDAGQGTDITLYFDTCSVELFAGNGTTVMTSLFFSSAAYDCVRLETSEPAKNGRLTVFKFNR